MVEFVAQVHSLSSACLACVLEGRVNRLSGLTKRSSSYLLFFFA